MGSGTNWSVAPAARQLVARYVVPAAAEGVRAGAVAWRGDNGVVVAYLMSLGFATRKPAILSRLCLVGFT